MSWDTANLNPRYRLPRPAPRASACTVPKDGATGAGGGGATKIQGGWARAAPPPAGYVTIGTMRYGVRFASETREEVPPRGDEANNNGRHVLHHQHSSDEDCCCGVGQLPWPRTSRIPLPAEKQAASINKRGGIFSRINSGELARGPTSRSKAPPESGGEQVYRSTLEWSQQRNAGVTRSCFGGSKGDDEDNGRDGVRMQRPPAASPANRRRILVRPKPDIPAYFKLCSSASSDSETCHLITPTGSRDNLVKAEDVPRNTLDRFHKIRLGGGENKDKKKVSRSSDKTEGLRRLTERLKGGGFHSSPDRRRHQVAVGTSATREQHSPPPADGSGSIQSSETPAEGMGTTGEWKSGAVEKTPEPPAKEDDLFDCVNLRLPKPESRTIVGSYAQRTIPFRSASFSQVDFSSADGKYIRSNAKSSQFPTPSVTGTALPLSTSSVIASCSLTLPRKKLSDIPSIRPSVSVCTEEPLGSTPSVDSAVGSDEGFVASAVSKIPVVNKSGSPDSPDAAHKTPGSRSLTYPLPRRGSRPDDDIPFSSIDGNGLKSLQYVAAGRELQEVQEESETSIADSHQSSSTQDEGETLQHDHKEEPPSEGDVFHDWRKAEECHITYEPPVCLGEVVVCTVEESDPTLSNATTESKVLECGSTEPVHEYTVSYQIEQNIPDDANIQCDDLNAENTSQTKGTLTDENCGECNSMHLTSVSSSLSAHQAEDAENHPALEDALNQCQEDTRTIQECSIVGCDTLSPPEGRNSPNTLPEQAHEVFITQWPSEGKETECPPEDLVPCDVARVSGEWQSEEVGTDASQEGVESCTDVEDNPPTHTVSIVSPQWQRSEEWDSPQEESQSPDESGGTRVRWPRENRRWLEKPKLVYQSSEEREEETPPTTTRRYHPPVRADSLSEGESDQGERAPIPRECTASPSPFPPSDLSDSEGRPGVAGNESRSPHPPRRYYKRPLRGPYGQMLEAEMSKAETNRISKLQLEFLEKYVPSPANSSRTSPATPEVPASNNNSRPRALTTQSLDDSQLKGGYGRSSPATTPSRTSPKRKVSANIPYSSGQSVAPSQQQQQFVCHQRTTSSPSQLEGYASSSPRPELLAELLRGTCSERVYNGGSTQRGKDTRTHVVVEIYDIERSYVESLQILVMKYLQPLKSPENAGLVDAALVDEIFYQVPAILAHHEVFLEELRKRLEHWDVKQKVGDIFLETFTKPSVVETYTLFLNNWKSAKEAIKNTCQAKPAFARFIEAMAREHKGKLDLDCLLIMPVQRIPRYELLIQALLKHTDPAHPDHQLLMEAQKEIHDLAMKINCTERETLKELEALIEGLINLVAPERTFIRHDLVTMVSGQGTRKERALFLFSDLLVITSIKRRSGTIRKPSTTTPGSVASTLEANKYKLLMRIPLDDLETVKAKDENLRRMQNEMENLTEDVATLNQINDLTASLHCPHSQLEEVVRDMLSTVNKQLAERQNSDSQLSYLELTLNTQNGIENLSVVFTKPEKRTSWEESFNEAKQKLALSADRRPSPEFLAPLPIRKTRAGLQFTCAAPTLGLNSHSMRDVWVCNSDGYVGQVCVLSLQPDPTVISCNGVCNARILCIASIPVGMTGSSSSSNSGQQFLNSKTGISISVEDTDESGGNTVQLDSSSSSEDEDENEEGLTGPAVSIGVEEDAKRIRSASDSMACDTTSSTDDTDSLQPTMWLGTEDGCIHVYNCSDNIRIKKNKVKIQHGSAVHCIIYLDNRVFVSLANGDISVYVRDHSGGWNTTDPYTVSVGTVATPVTRMLPIAGKLWCGCHNSIKILNTSSLEVEHSFQVNSDSSRAVTCMALSGLGVWISIQNLAIIRLFHATTYECLCDVNVAPAVTKMLASCDDIIRQHKAACLRVTSILACKDLLWIGTSAGVILTMPLPHITPATTKLSNVPNATGVPHGHTGHVRFLTYVETVPAQNNEGLMIRPSIHHRYSLKSKPELQSSSNTNVKLLVISGGDGYEDFRTSSVSEVAGREDSTNHLLLWHV